MIYNDKVGGLYEGRLWQEDKDGDYLVSPDLKHSVKLTKLDDDAYETLSHKVTFMVIT